MRGHKICFYAELAKIIPNYHQYSLLYECTHENTVLVPLQIVMHGISEVLASTRVIPALVTLGNDPEM